MNRKTWLVTGIVCVLIAAFLFVFSDARVRSKDTRQISGSEFHYRVNGLNTAENTVSLELLIRDAASGRWHLAGDSRATRIANFQVSAARPVAMPTPGPDGQAAAWVFDNPCRQDLIVRWDALPGGIARHGHQGWIDADYALLEGAIYLIPKDAMRTNAEPGKIRVRVAEELRDKFASTMVEDAEGLNPALDGKLAFSSLKNSTIVFGIFDRSEREVRGVHVRIFLPQEWTEAGKAEINETLFRLFQVFSGVTPLRNITQYTVILTRGSSDWSERRVLGSMWSSGQAFSYAGHKPWRVLELFLHRLGHAANRYPPSGMVFAHEDEWFVEGWASWIEFEYPRLAELSGSERLSYVLRWYHKVLQGKTDYADVPLEQPAAQRSTVQNEYLHYCKAPLAVRKLDAELKWLSNGERDVSGLMKTIYEKYGGTRTVVRFKEELSAYAGTDMDGFIDRFIRGTERVD
ncbi:MAG TPA: hypothetical protein PLP17_01475 [Oligoflexia bacterium]|nr:hypothetical protein [Oligoflexia bacterium]